MLTIGSLFSGVGGIELGLERTGHFKTIWNCEVDLYASAVLRKHWPEVPNIGDITKVDWSATPRPDLICGGFPCQDISIAGKQKGIVEGKRSSLWSEFANAIRILRPRYALIENVPALSDNGLWLVVADLAKMGYDAEWGIISAKSVGAPHLRERIFIIACPNNRCEQKNEIQSGRNTTKSSFVDVSNSNSVRCGGWGDETLAQPQDDAEVQGRSASVNNPNSNSSGLGARGDNTKDGGNMVPEIRKSKEEDCKRKGRKLRFNKICACDASDNGSKRIQRQWKGQIHRFPEFQRFQDVRRIEELKGRPDIPEPLFRGGRDGVPCWVDRIKCCGNSVVPAVAQTIGEWIVEAEGLK